MEALGVIEKLLDQKVLKILKLFVQDEEDKYYLREISKKTGISAASVYRILGRLQKLKLIKLIKLKKFKVYTLAETEHAQALKKLLGTDSAAISDFVKSVSYMDGLEMIVQHGKQEKKRANILLIGNNIDSNELKSICAEIRSLHNFIITPLVVTKDQFEQMSTMGLYSGEKKILYENHRITSARYHSQ